MESECVSSLLPVRAHMRIKWKLEALRENANTAVNNEPTSGVESLCSALRMYYCLTATSDNSTDSKKSWNETSFSRKP